jgi:predicted permease
MPPARALDQAIETVSFETILPPFPSHPTMRSFLQDLRHGVRLLGRQPGFALVATLVVGLGIGANTTMFSLVDALALKPRLGDTERMVSLFSKNRQESGGFRAFSYPNYLDLREQRGVFSALAAHAPTLVGITEGSETRRAFIDIVTADFFAAFGVAPSLGRAFTEAEAQPRADIPVTILSDTAWQQLGAPPEILGQTIRLNQRDFTIVGVAPRGFGGTMAVVTPELWLPTGVYDSVSSDFAREGLPGSLADRTHHALFVVGRLREGLTASTADGALDAVARRLENAYPVENKDQTLLARPVSRLSISTSPEAKQDPIAVLSVVLMSMSGVVLLIACLNLANMQLARGAARRKEFAIRASIGGGRLRAMRQLLTEGLALSLPGALVALGISWASMRLLNAAVAGRLPIQLAIDSGPDWRVFGATLGFAVLATVLFGLGPALALVRSDLVTSLKEQAGEVPVGRSRFAARHLLVMGQLALSLALLTGGGLFVRGALVAARLDPGFTFDRGILVQTDTALAGYDTVRGLDLYARTLDRLRQLPGVTAVGFGSLMPFGEITEGSVVQRPGPRVRNLQGTRSRGLGGGAGGSVEGALSAVTYSISPGFFTALNLRILRGRDFTTAEAFGQGPPVAIVDEALARRIFGAVDPIGQQLQINRSAETMAPDVVEIVGVAPPILHQMNDGGPGPQIYRPQAQDFRAGVTFHIATNASSSEAEALMLPAIRQLLREVDDRLPVVTLETRPMFRERNLMLWMVRAGAWVFTAFGLVALGMAALGIYGVKAYLVSRRTREIGIRMALGANPRQVVRLVMSDGLWLTVAGLAVGLALSVAMGPAVGSLLFQGSGFDGPVVAAAFGTLLAAASLASWLPARRATRIAPSVAVRDL